MLVLSRRENSSIKIGSDVTVTVLSVQRQQVRLGIEAPRTFASCVTSWSIRTKNCLKPMPTSNDACPA